MGEMSGRIERKLKEALRPIELSITDESHKHAGHAGARPGGETHFNVAVTSIVFKNKSRIERHRMIYSILENEIKDGIHALSLQTKSPGDQ